MAKLKVRFNCYWCQRELAIGEEIQSDENSFYCKTCPEFKEVN